MLAVLLRADGWQVAYLGADTPCADALALAGTVDARALCLSATLATSAQALNETLSGERLPANLSVVIGGAGAPRRLTLGGTRALLRKLVA